MTFPRAARLMLALSLAGIAGAAGSAARSGANSAEPAWAEMSWPFLLDEWGIGQAFRCGDMDCGLEARLFVRVKRGFCNCFQGVADDAELDRLSDFTFLGGASRPLGPGRAIALGDPMVSEEHITAFGWATPQEIDDIMALAIRVNDFLSGLFLGVGIRLIDFKMECGRLWENEMMRIVVADEISPDSCRLWDIKSSEKLDKDRFRRDLGGLLEAYTEVAKRLGIMSEGERPQGMGPILVKG